MHITIEGAVTLVRKVIKQADSSRSHLVFINWCGKIDIVSEVETDDGETFFRLHNAATIKSDGPFFEILSILVGGRLFINGRLGSDDQVHDAVSYADDERDRVLVGYGKRCDAM